MIKKAIEALRVQTKKYAKSIEIIQLSFLYFIAVVVLTYTIRNSLGYFPEMLYTLFPFITNVFDIPAFKVLATPEKIFMIYVLLLEIIVHRSFFQFAPIIKYNVLLIFVLEMIQNLLISCWDILFSRELSTIYGGVVSPKNPTMYFYFVIFLLFFCLYIYSYLTSLQGRFPIFPGPLKGITDSVAFWLKIKVTQGGRKKRQED
jgi:hypothetical protein